MKEVYVKPQLHIEYFALSQSIASCWNVQPGGNTTGKPTQGDKTTCGWDLGGWVIWVNKQNGCVDEQAGENEVIEGVCYNNPSGYTVAFSS